MAAQDPRSAGQAANDGRQRACAAIFRSSAWSPPKASVTSRSSSRGRRRRPSSDGSGDAGGSRRAIALSRGGDRPTRARDRRRPSPQIRSAGWRLACPASARSPPRRFGQPARPAHIQIRPRFRRLDRVDAQAELDRRQGETRRHHQAGQSLHPTASGVGRHLPLAGGAEGKGALSDWPAALRARKPAKVVAVALANKLARIVWAVITTGEPPRGALYAKA